MLSGDLLKILHVVGARPNFMKAAPAIHALAARDGVVQNVVHTGQHYDAAMSDVFFRQLSMPAPDHNLNVGSGSHAVQTALIMTRFEEVVLLEQPDLVLVYGDVNSTVAAALVCSKLRIKIGHVEAGLRSFDRTMPEEINRLITDQISDLLFTPSEDADRNLLREGISTAKIFLVGNLMIDSLVRLLPFATTPNLPNLDRPFVLATLHRPSNVDDPHRLPMLLSALNEISREIQVVFPVHPRTKERFANLGMHTEGANLRMIEPLGYLEFLALQRDARAVVTDSGGVQEETTYLGVPCITVRPNTERPVTIGQGTNRIVNELELLAPAVLHEVGSDRRRNAIPPLWDGAAGSRVAEIVTAQSAATWENFT